MSVIQTLLEARNALAANKVAILSVLALPLLIITASEVAAAYYGTPGSAVYAAQLVSYFLYCSVAIFLHRLIILGTDAENPSPFIPKGRVFKFLIYSIALGLILIPAILLIHIPVVGFLLSYIAITYIVCRLSFIFPAIAVDVDWTFKDSWQATRRHHLQLFVLLGIIPFVLNLPYYIPATSLAAFACISILSTIAMVIGVAILSVCFEKLTTERSHEFI
ncbi:hypothetical protein DDZ13_00175 [Coraliomargarita sinensis]|uniref:DUF975 family protein n=1 Tax=Coraliomargarita sinensis TaxID=2174842 RepID=A0A317ZIB0_9BACT|nr:hypothetical protein [Coraliomargarita sinensis]PXA05316.1 hypothetical protein DDZ13_00175 [Coraliomargarita sinensis]